MPSAGELLRQERLTRNRNIRDLANETCISSRYLEALESNDLKVFPGEFFYRSFLKQYAQALRLDAATTERILTAAEPIHEPDPIPALNAAYETAKIESKASRLHRPKTSTILILLAAVLVGCSGLYAVWYKVQLRKETAVEAERTPAPAQTTVPAPTSAPGNTTPAPDPSPAAAVSEPAAAPADAAPASGTMTVDLSATEKTWVSLSSEGKTLFMGVLDASETKNFALTQAAKLVTGNAAGLDVRWNGKPIGPIGPRGQVRLIVFTSANYQIVTPQKKTGA